MDDIDFIYTLLLGCAVGVVLGLGGGHLAAWSVASLRRIFLVPRYLRPYESKPSNVDSTLAAENAERGRD